MLIRVALWLILLCLPLFLVAKMLLIFTFIVFATFATQFAAFVLLAGFCLLIFAGLFGILQRVWRVLSHYFSASQHGQRKCLFVKNQHLHRTRLLHFQRLQLTYFKELQRKRLFEKNNRQHINALSEAIGRDLQNIKHQLSKDYFSQLQDENRRYRMQQNEQALLKLHQKIVTLTGK